jgi:DNA-binding response OmpR family regulator
MLSESLSRSEKGMPRDRFPGVSLSGTCIPAQVIYNVGRKIVYTRDAFARKGNPLSTPPPIDEDKKAKNSGLDLDKLDSSKERRRVLIIDDDPDMVTLLKITLQAAGMDVTGALGAEEAIEKCIQFRPQAILLDLMMPVIDGWETLQMLREITDAPVLIITARDGKPDIIRGFDTGADDYVTKPVYPPEIVARVQALIRRAEPGSSPTTLFFPGYKLKIDLSTHEVSINQQSIDLPPKEFAVLATLAEHAPSPVPYIELAEKVWGQDTPKIRQRMKWMIHQLRRKLDHDNEEDLILNRSGVGYLLNVKE